MEDEEEREEEGGSKSEIVNTVRLQNHGHLQGYGAAIGASVVLEGARSV